MAAPVDKQASQPSSVLAARIDAEVARILASQQPSQSVIYTGNRHDAIPSVLITDPVLEPVDKLVWMVTSSHIGSDGVRGVLPSYKVLARLANIRSSSTIARALAILRVTRWLTLCRQVRDCRGRFCGNVYALHDEPASLAEALELDKEYFDFLANACSHTHRRVQIVARSTQQSIDEDIMSGRHAEAPTTALERRLRAAQVRNEASDGRYFGLTQNAQDRLNTAQGNDNAAASHRLRNSKLASSSREKKDTTTTSSNALSENAQRLVFPARLNDAHKALAMKHLQRVSRQQRQPLLDELEGRLQAERLGAGPVWDAIRYLARLCELAQAGEFHLNLGIAIASERDRLQKQLAVARKKSPLPAKNPRAEENIQKLRDILTSAGGDKG